MSLQFIFGNSGSGKSHYLYEHIIKESMKYPHKNYIILVPEQFTMQTQKELVLRHPNKGILNVDVLSFNRLAYRVFEEIGQKQKTILDDVGKNFILRKLAKDHESELKVLSKNLKKLGYISEVKSVLSEFTQYDIREKELQHMMEYVGEASGLYWKLQDLSVIYHNFRSYLEESYITAEELLEVLSEVVNTSKMLKNSVIVLDGFTGFTPIQHKLLKELLGICEKVWISITMDGEEDPYILKNKLQLFAFSKETVSNLLNIAKSEGVEIQEPVCLFQKPVYRFRDHKALGFLESELFRYSKKQYVEEQKAITIHMVKNPVEETVFAARQIRSLVRSGGYRYRDIALIVSDMDSYAKHLENTFQTFKIPVFMDYKRSILLNSFVEYIRSLLFMIEQNYTYESVFRFLRTGLTFFTNEEIDRVENYVVEFGIKGMKKWQTQWNYSSKATKEEELEQINDIRARFVEHLCSITQVLKQRKKTVRTITVALYDFLVKEEMQQKMKQQEEWFQAEGEHSLAKEYAQIYRIVIDLFDQFVELLGEEEIPLKEYCDLLDAGIEEAKVGIIPPGIDQVVVGDIERTRLKGVKALFFLGINDAWIPGNQNKYGLISDRDREQFELASLRLAPSAKEQIYIQKFYLYLNLTKPTQKLYLSYSKVSADGKNMRPAYLISEILKLYPQMKICDEEQKSMKEIELTEETAMNYLIEGLRDKSQPLGNEWMELFLWYRNNPTWAKQVIEIVKASFYKKPTDKLSKEVARKLYEKMEKASVSRMEQFSSCAFAHFLTYGLHLREREEYAFEAIDMGNVFHKALEEYANKIEQEGYQWTTLPEDLKRQWVEECVETSIEAYGSTVLQSSARNAYMITRIKRLMGRTIWALTIQLEKGDFTPSGYEVSFGNGKIDRVDTYEEDEQVYVKVVDYKTGNKSFDLVSLYHGLQLQLVVYLSEAMKMEQEKQPQKKVIPAGIFYYQIKDPIVDKISDETLLQEAILKELKLDGLVNESETVIRHLDKDFLANSMIIPVGRNKNETLSQTSKTLTDQQFEIMTTFTKKTIQTISSQILDGEVEANPYELGVKTGCDYCKYMDICGFDMKIEGYEYRKLKKMKKDEIIERMREETSWE
ncbi:MAG: PD-(D/E)XK nuclease family protein [Lachnospiraceae bacterium]